MDVDVQKLKNHIENLGIKQNVISKKIGIAESKLSLSLQEKRKLSVGEYAAICNFLKKDFDFFLKEV